MSKLTVTEALKARTSVRAFSDKPVGECTVHELLEAARWSPSGGNLQPWKVIVVAGAQRDAVARLASTTIMENPAGEADEYPIYPKGLGEPYRSRRYEVGEAMYVLLGIPKEDRAARLQWVIRNFEFFGAPVGLFFVIERSMGHGQWAHLGMFMQSLALVAQEAGLATCMQESWGMVRKTLHRHFELTDDQVIYCGMALGYGDSDEAVNTLRTARAEVGEFASLLGF